jgi:hypothetical protein
VNTKPIPLAPPVALTRDALELIRSYAIHYPELPAPYITLSTHTTTQLGLLVPLAGFEPWREALEIDTEDTCLYPVGDRSHLSASSVVRARVFGRQVEILVHLYVGDLPLLVERPDAEAVAA